MMVNKTNMGRRWGRATEKILLAKMKKWSGGTGGNEKRISEDEDMVARGSGREGGTAIHGVRNVSKK